jgi:hypothetical protein
LIAAAFLPKYRGASRWFRIAFILSGVFALAWSALGFTLLFCASDISRYARVVLDRSRIFVGGIVFGLLLSLFCSPEFWYFARRPSRFRTWLMSRWHTRV